MPGSRGTEPKLGASVVEEVKLDVLAPSEQLPFTLSQTERLILALLHYGYVAGDDGIGTRLQYDRCMAL